MPDDEADDLMIGQKLGNYEITQKLAHGGMGVIYQARHETLKRLVAIKFLASDYSENQEYVERFLREARAAALLNHPNIITVYDAGVTENVYYLIMEYVSGHDLAYVLRQQGPLNEARALILMKQSAYALAYAHQEGIIHQDIKPQNLILTSEGQIKLCDLGLATWVEEKGIPLLKDGEVMGTPFYISPEQVQNPQNVDARTDIYSLGATFYHILTGQPPFRGENPDEIMTRHIEEAPCPPGELASISEGMNEILLKMMQKKPDDRFQSMQDVIEALTLLEEGKFGGPPPAPPVVTEIDEGLFQSKMATLQRRLSGKTEFPTMSNTIPVITKLVSVTDNTTINELAEAILSDFALTNKILKLVNSVFYSGFGEKISTVSQAVMVLGLAQVRNAAVSLMLFENLQNRPLAKEIKEASISNYLSGVIGKNLALRLRTVNKEEAFICSIFHNLGELLTAFYLPSEFLQIKKLVEDQGTPPEAAVLKILGNRFEAFGMKVGREWNFPEIIISTMERLPEGQLPQPKTFLEQIHSIVGFSNDLCSILRDTTSTDEARDAAFGDLMERYALCFPMTGEEIANLLDIALEELATFTQSLDMKVKVSDYLDY
jgi:eukaryotic-like serine/threonine-protein kinase